ncbi:hypothetical protein L083_3264 [Actinoplanes sp. N902-109]|nr:hypothetical protein L083_3264 [Actinoplanes sp. N902-109]
MSGMLRERSQSLNRSTLNNTLTDLRAVGPTVPGDEKTRLGSHRAGCNTFFRLSLCAS